MTANVSVVSQLPISEALTDAKLRASPVPITDSERGAWGYVAGTNGTVNIARGRRVLGITARSGTGGTLTINGGDSIVVPTSGSVTIAPKGNLMAPTIVFSGTVTSYFVESVI